MTPHNRMAAGLLERAARLAEACEYTKAISTMNLALTEIQKGIYAQYRADHNIEENQ